MKLRPLAMTVLLIIWGSLPMLACMLPHQQLTYQEKQCCKKMAGNCGGMNADHSCCKHAVNPVPPLIISTTHSALQLPSASPLINAPKTALRVSSQVGISGTGYSPPESPPSFNLVLRI